MRGLPPQPELVIDDVYRDVDGSLVQLLTVADNICCWSLLGSASDEKQMSHRDNFVRRFVAVQPAKPGRRRATRRPVTPAAVVLPRAA